MVPTRKTNQRRPGLREIALALLCALLLTGLLAGEARAQQPAVRLSQLQIDLWPEYDLPGMLVIYRMTLSPDTLLPAEMSLRIPRAVGKPHKVAQQSMDELLYDLDYTLDTSDEWLTIRFTALSQQVRVEYYDPRLDRIDSERRFVYQWPADFDIQQLVFNIQQPDGASRFDVQPEQGVGKEGEDGMIYYTIEKQNVKAGTELALEIQYEKASEQLSHVLQPVRPVEPIAEARIGWSTFMELLPLAVLVFVALVISGSALWYWQGGGKPRGGLRIPHKRSAARAVLTGVYCRECGKRAMAGDTYCRACGAKLSDSSR
ncbi:MAG: zinc ribbon domain-containing protein [Chloroflexi bacterium]|nr:zinc ribbon domain-containing protein [Chloroflexota bacterium]